MLLREALLLCIEVAFVASYLHGKPIALTPWPGKCTKGSRILNDCNWCECGPEQKYLCDARLCHEIDMFGHFNDAIQNINVGIEGHGVWRTSQTACEPGVQYLRENLICICNENGAWPNPVCRDIFRILHHVDTSFRSHPIKTQKCEAAKLYLIGCNVCFCPQSERIDSNFCTKINCTNDDPILKDTAIVRSNGDNDETLEVYAECQLNRKYNLGCRRCMCLRNNRLHCDACDRFEDKGGDDEKRAVQSSEKNLCDNVPPGEIVESDCNLCMCDKKGLLYCTSKQCLGVSKSTNLATMLRDDGFSNIESPFSDLDCTPQTVYWKDCNKCICNHMESGQVYYSCTLKQCRNTKNVLDKLTSNCVKGTVYESNCQICRCDMVHGAKMETCHINPKCTGVKAVGESRSLNIKSLHGYCEPGHTYQRDCNTCRCLPDGKVLMCTSKACNKAAREPVIVDLIPITQNDGRECPGNHMYYVDCNLCFCLDNGNVLCSTADCNADRAPNIKL